MSTNNPATDQPTRAVSDAVKRKTGCRGDTPPSPVAAAPPPEEDPYAGWAAQMIAVHGQPPQHLVKLINKHNRPTQRA